MISSNGVRGYIVVVFAEGGLGYHHTVAKVAAICRVTHFLCEGITWIDLARNVREMALS